MLDNIRIEGYKSIKHLDLNLGAINILIGANGAGKTNFISFFELVNAIYEQRLQNFTMTRVVDRLLFYGLKKTKRIEGSLKFSDNKYSFTLNSTNDGSRLLIKEERSWYKKDASRRYGIEESTIKNSDEFRDKWLRKYLESYKVYHFHDTSVGSPLRSESNIHDLLSLSTDGGNLAAILFLLQGKYPKTLRRIELIVQSVMPCFERFVLAPNPQPGKEGYLLPMGWREINRPEKYFDVNDLSDGSLRFIALATLLLQPELPKIIIIDEPELGLHPVAINKLAGMIKSAAARDCQIIITTQSVDLINNFDPECIITVDREDEEGGSVFNRLKPRELKTWLENYSPGDLWTKGVIDGQPVITHEK